MQLRLNLLQTYFDFSKLSKKERRPGKIAGRAQALRAEALHLRWLSSPPGSKVPDFFCYFFVAMTKK
jgi:hypothetical protein